MLPNVFFVDCAYMDTHDKNVLYTGRLHFSLENTHQAFCSFSPSSRSLSDLHLSQIHFTLSVTWALILAQLWKQRPHVLYWVPDFMFLCHTLYTKVLSAFTPGPGFLFSPSFTNSTAKVVAHTIIAPKHDITRSCTCEIRHVVLITHEVLSPPATHARPVIL